MKNKKVILITEDEGPIRRLLSDKLKDEGFTVFEAKDGEEGLIISFSEHPDLIILDMMLPKISGLEMLQEIRKDEWGKKVSVMVLTNLNDSKTLSDVMKNEVFEYFVKTDIKIEDFIKIIKTKLGVF